VITEVAELPDDFKKALSSGKLVYGIKSVLKEIKKGNVKKVIIASNIPSNYLDDLKRYSEISNFEIIKYKGTNMELGVLCKRAHSVLAAAIVK